MKIKINMIITLLLILSNYLFGQNSSENHYETIKKIDNVEIREYYESMNISYHDSFSDSYFQYLANYIFGGNYNNEKISTTIRLHGDYYVCLLTRLRQLHQLKAQQADHY